MLKYFDGDQQLERKADDSPVTIADQEVNRLVIEEIAKAFPNDGVIGEEESTAEYGPGRRWFCDPIDGTKGYIWGTPTAMFSLALVIDGRPVMGLTLNPFVDWLFIGVRGEGSYCNGKKLQVSNQKLTEGYVAGTSSIERIVKQPPHLMWLLERGARLGTFSSAVLKVCLVTKGKFIGYIEELVNAHDMAASQVILEEAGGKMTGLDGGELDYSKPFKGAIASNGIVHDLLVEAMKEEKR